MGDDLHKNRVATAGLLCIVCCCILPGWFLYQALGLGCFDHEVPEKDKERFEREGVDLVGDYDSFGVQVKYITAKSVDDGLLGGKYEEPTFSIACDQAVAGKLHYAEYYKEFKEGDVARYGNLLTIDDEACFYAGVGPLAITCAAGSGVKISIVERDDFSSDETGSIYVPPDMLASAYHSMQMSFGISLLSTGSWDRFWNGALELMGGICLTDFLPGVRQAKALKMSVKAIKRIKRANKGVKRFKKAQAILEDCSATGIEPCGDAADILSSIWNAQCINANPDGGTYNIVLQISSSTRHFLSIGLMILSAAVF